MTNIIIIDGVNSLDRRVSVSIDSFLFGVFAIRCGSDGKARSAIRQTISSGLCVNSKQVQHFVLRKCLKKSLLDKYDGSS